MTGPLPLTVWILRRGAGGAVFLSARDQAGDERILSSSMDTADVLTCLPDSALRIGRHPRIDHPDVLDAWVSDLSGLQLLDQESLGN